MDYMMADGMPAVVGKSVTKFGDNLTNLWVQYLEEGEIVECKDGDVRVRFTKSNSQRDVRDGEIKFCRPDTLQSFVPILFEEDDFLKLISEVRYGISLGPVRFRRAATPNA